MAAAAGGHPAVVAALLEAGAPWNAVDRRRRCAGDLAMERDDFESANLLLDAGADYPLLVPLAHSDWSPASASRSAFSCFGGGLQEPAGTMALRRSVRGRG